MLSYPAQTLLAELQGFATDDPSRPYCYRADETGEWYWLTEADLERYWAMAAKHAHPMSKPDLYTEWCQCSGELMTRADAVRLNLIDADDDSDE